MAIVLADKLTENVPHVIVRSTQYPSIKHQISVSPPTSVNEEGVEEEIASLEERIKEAIEKAEIEEQQLDEAKKTVFQLKLGNTRKKIN